MTTATNGGAESAALAVKGIDNVLFAVGDLAAAVDFYTTKLGFALVFRLDEPGLALFRLGAEPGGLLVRSAAVPSVATPAAACARLWLEVADARAAATVLTNRGVVLLTEPFQVATGWTVEIADPWGNVLGFTDYSTMPERGRP